MAYSSVTYTGNGVTTTWAVPFPYLDRSHIAVTVNGASTSFSWIGDSTVMVSPAAANGAEVRISRSTNRQARLANYADAQVLDELSMDNDALQIFYVAQEAFDAVADAASGGDMRRSMNLSDVFSISAARDNLGALAKTGDTMSGPLILNGAPTDPNGAASKSYVDSAVAILGGSGVGSFNGRTGNVTLALSDVTSALNYTPVNKAGDTMIGPLVLAADPTSTMQAATKQYVDSHVGGGSTGEYVFGPSSPVKPAAVLLKNVSANTAALAGAADLKVFRSGGVPMTSFSNHYGVTVSGQGDISMAATIVGAGGTYAGFYGAAWGPRTSAGQPWQVIGAYFNSTERVGDQGLKRDRSGNSTISLLVAPAAPLNVGDGPPVSYNTSFGIAFTAATPNAATQRMWVPLFFEVDSTVKGGIQALHRGGSTAALAPVAAIEIRDNFTYGIDTRSAVLDPILGYTAMILAQGQSIHYGPNQAIYVDPDGNLMFADPVAGLKKLNELGGGSGVNILPLNNVWTGTNKHLGATPEATFAGDPAAHLKVSRTAPAGGPVVVQAGLLVNTKTDVTSNGFEWNALFHLENYANQGENVAMYSKATRYGSGGTWAGVFEARSQVTSTNGLWGLEIDLCSDGLDPYQNQQGIAVFYGAHTNTFGSGGTTKQTNGLLIWPFVSGRNTLQNGVHVGGYCDFAYRASASGYNAFRAEGSYAGPAIDIGAVTNTPIALSFAPGSRMFFTSGTGNGGNTTWWSGGFVPNFVGAIEVLIDGNKRYIPIALNHP